MPGVRVKENEPIESAIRRFTKQCEKAGILAELRKREHYAKPTVRKKKEVLAALAIFAALYIICQVAGWVLYRMARAIFLGPVDRVFGFLVGAAKAVAISALLCMLVTSRRGLPQLAERVHDSPMLSAFVDQGWDFFALAREESDVKLGWQRPYSKMDEAREALNHFLTPKPSTTPPPSRAHTTR